LPPKGWPTVPGAEGISHARRNRRIRTPVNWPKAAYKGKRRATHFLGPKVAHKVA